ncbi:RAMP superfamily CRISPR-associated protein [Agriterribacter sp.]|uniref:RAMP superfamily CRISPR-associated protein n=1 Tax=Agriterribacter sp. TaxID=2821509 RepID=UPI002C2079EE|nr:RAMP superfamily CRISPR-associated protein [Agriterribacter sp.]HRP56366.1 RAMP superfamily CRISPR-associated protein [Agriterribacter sp.]
MKTHEVLHFNLEVITPTHIGMGKEKEYTEGLDFLYDQSVGEYVVLKPDVILKQIGSKDISLISNQLRSGNTKDFSNYLLKKNLINDQSIRYTWSSRYPPGREPVKSTYRDAMGAWTIPGSSIKGVIRGIILKYLYNPATTYNPKNLLGEIKNDPLRFLQVTDCPVEGLPAIYPVKIFSADVENDIETGKWKHERRGGHDGKFNSRGFVSYYEMLTDGIYKTGVAKGKFRIGWGTTSEVYLKKRMDMPNFEKLFGHQDQNWLLGIIQKHTDQYLQQEIDFFEIYPNEELSDESFWEELHWLKEENLRNTKSCLIRVGSNVGYHSITGNWEFLDYVDAVKRNRGRMVKGVEKAFKTRKLVFDFNDENERRFALPGFVRITLA